MELMTTRCPYCNTENPSEAIFCQGCGRRLRGGRSAQTKAGVRVVIRVPAIRISETLTSVDLWLTAIAAYMLFQAVFFLYGALVMGFGALVMSLLSEAGGVVEEELGVSVLRGIRQGAILLSFLYLFSIVLAVLESTAAVGLFRRKTWARELTVILQVVVVAASFVSLVLAISWATLLQFVGTAVLAGLIWYYLRRPEVKEALE